MVRVIILSLMLFGCVTHNNVKPILGKETSAPYGWEYTYCPNHRDEAGCKQEPTPLTQ